MKPALPEINHKAPSKVTPRLRKINSQLAQHCLDGLILCHQPNISYLTEYPSRDSYCLVSPRGSIYITDSRYTAEAKLGLKAGIKVIQFDASVFQEIASAINRLGCQRVGFEERYLAFAEYQKIKGYLKKGVRLLPTHGLVEELRQSKDAEEIKRVKQAARITRMAFRFIREFIRAGKREIEVAAELERFIRYRGAKTSAFEIIVASGPNSSFPHHITGKRKIRNNEPVLIDLGVDFLGYKSDLTRVFFLGKINPLFRRVYDTVLEARRRAIGVLRPGVGMKTADAQARNYIAKKGFAGLFGHNLGHGVGLEVHEAPTLSPRSREALKKGMVFTVEPGIYLPGEFGVRIEDMVLLRQRGPQLLGYLPAGIEDIRL